MKIKFEKIFTKITNVINKIGLAKKKKITFQDFQEMMKSDIFQGTQFAVNNTIA